MGRGPMPTKRQTKHAATVREPQDATPKFPVVGIGASAGGLEALKELFRNVPAESEMAFVVVQHLDPTRKGMLVELLQHASHLPVVAAAHDARIERGHVYVIPSNKELSVAGGRLRLSAPLKPRGLRLPIDVLFRSLAEAFGERSIGVVLSGMGSDGTAGLRAIREHEGATFAQSVESAEFDSMPRSAIDAGVVDVVALAEELPEKIARRVELSFGTHGGTSHGRLAGSLPQILALVRRTTGHDFSSYKVSTIARRIARRMSLHQLKDGAAYVRYLSEAPKEAELLFAEMLIGVTSFFRDADAWQEIEKSVLPSLVARCPEGTILRAWVPACSTGEEAYSLAIAFLETLEACVPPKKLALQIFATDVDRSAIERARQGIYPSSIATDVGPDRLNRFFLPEGAGFRVRNVVRDHVVFATHNVLEDPPFTKLDLVSCRNLLIYLSAETQKSLLRLFHYALLPDGILFLGSAETADGVGELFAARNGKERIHRRLGPSSVVKASWPLSFAATSHKAFGRKEPPEPTATPITFQRIVEQLILERFAPAAVVTSARGDST
jgi:two-component system, chemotaxis family, CheB/CheR fusion protein